MKAVFLLQTDPFHPKPALRAVREAETLREAGWEVSFVSWIKGDEPPPDTPSPVRVRRILRPVPPLESGIFRRGLAFLYVTRDLSSAVVDEAPDLIVAHDFEVLRAAVAAKKALGVPLLYDSHEDWPALIAENSLMEARIAGWQERRLCAKVDHIVTVSAPIASKFRDWGRPTTVIYSARPTREIQLADRSASRGVFQYAIDDFVVGFAGTFGAGRGLEVLLHSLGELPGNVKALLVGGPHGDAGHLFQVAAELGVERRVRLDDYRPFPELAPYYAAMDLGVILLDDRPNHRRALPNKLFDYMAHGVPVLVPNYPPMRSLVEQTHSGIILEKLDAPALAQTILEWSRNRTTLAELGRAGRAHFLNGLAWNIQSVVFLQTAARLVGVRTAVKT